MINLDSLNVSITQIRYFTVAYESNSFTRAARLLNVTQSAISKNIAALEEYLGFQLFIRDKKRLIPTRTAKFLYNEWLGVLSALDKSIDDARSLQGGHANTLNVGILSTHKPSAYLYPIIDIFRVINPKVNVYVEEYPSETIRDMVINGELDIGFNVLYDLEELGAHYFESKVIRKCPLEVGMLRGNPLAQKEELTVADLKDYDFINISARFTPSYYKMIQQLCINHGFTPNTTRYTNDAASQLLNLRSKKEIFIMDRFYLSYGDPYFEWRPLAGTSSGVTAAWKTDNKKKGLRDFLDAIEEFMSVAEIF